MPNNSIYCLCVVLLLEVQLVYVACLDGVLTTFSEWYCVCI